MSTARSFIPMSTAATASSATAAAPSFSATAAAAAPSATAATAVPSSSRSFKIVFRSMQSLVLLVFLIGVVITVAWLILNPRPPAFRLDSLSLSGLPDVSDASSPPPKFDVRIRLTATNPNKKIGVVIGGVNLCLVLIPSKCQLRLSTHNNKSSSEHYIGERDHGPFEVKASPSPGRGRRSKRSFQFTVDELLRKGSEVMSVKMDVSVKFMHAYLPSKRGSVVVECKDLRVGLSSTHIGNLKDGGRIARFASLDQQKINGKPQTSSSLAGFPISSSFTALVNLLKILISVSLKNVGEQCMHGSREFFIPFRWMEFLFVW